MRRIAPVLSALVVGCGTVASSPETGPDGGWSGGSVIDADTTDGGSSDGGSIDAGADGGSGAVDGGSGRDAGSGNSDAHVSVQFTGTGGGHVTSSPAGIDCPMACSMTVASGTAVTLTAVADGSSTFLGWGGACSGNGCTLSARGDDVAYANFEAKPPPPRSWAVRVAPSGSGTVRSSPGGIDCGQSCSATFTDRTHVVLSAFAASGWRFSGWSGACSGTGDCSVTMTADTTVQATFEQLPPPPPDECAGSTPATLPQSVVASLPDSDCLGGISDDGIGNYVLGYMTGPGPVYPSYLFFTISDGKAQRVGTEMFGSDEGTIRAFSQPSGFTTFTVFGYSTSSSLRSFTHEGTVISTEDVALGSFNDPPSSQIAIDPSGGSALVRSQRESGLWVTSYRRLDKTGTPGTDWIPLGSSAVRTTVRGVGVALSGDVLIMISDPAAAWTARWVTRSGAPASDWFVVQSHDGSSELRFLMDGSLAFRVHAPRYPFHPGAWLGVFEDRKTSMSPAPQWLQDRSGGEFFVIRNGRAYASFAAAGGACGPDLEVVATSGQSCACLAVPNLNAISSVVRDGSLIVPRPEPNPNKCQYDLYPQLLR